MSGWGKPTPQSPAPRVLRLRRASRFTRFDVTTVATRCAAPIAVKPPAKRPISPPLSHKAPGPKPGASYCTSPLVASPSVFSSKAGGDFGGPGIRNMMR